MVQVCFCKLCNKSSDSTAGECCVIRSTVRSARNIIIHISLLTYLLPHRGSTVVTLRKDAVSIPAGVSGFFIDIKFFR